MITKKKYELNKNFTHDLILGEIREKKLAEILANKPIEVKTEMGMWQEKGNLAIEIEFDGKPSGLYKTHSEYWWHNLEVRNKAYMSLFFKVDILKAIVKKIEDKYPHRIIMGGDNSLSKLVLVPLAGLFFLEEKDLNWRMITNKNKKGVNNMSESYTLFDSTDDDSIDKKKIETDKEKLINALEVDEKMSSIQAPNNIVEYMQLAEEQELAEVQPQEPKPESTTLAPSLDTKEDKRLANMKTVIKRFDDIENKINKIIELLSKDTGEQK